MNIIIDISSTQLNYVNVADHTTTVQIIVYTVLHIVLSAPCPYNEVCLQL